MKRLIIVLLLFISCTAFAEWRYVCGDPNDPNTCKWMPYQHQMVVPVWQYFFMRDPSQVLLVHNPDGKAQYLSKDRYVDYDNKNIKYSHREWLSVIAAGWLTKYRLEDFAALASQWEPEKEQEPNLPPVETPKGWTAVNSKVFHLLNTCQYWRSTMGKIDIAVLLEMDRWLCTWCASHGE